MEKDLQKVFSNAKYHPELKLTDDIWRIIVARQERNARIKIWTYAMIGIASFVALFPVIHNLVSQFATSGFSEYLSLGFSDSASIVPYWKEFVLSLADSLPATSLILSLSLIVVFLVCVRRAARYLRSPLLIA